VKRPALPAWAKRVAVAAVVLGLFGVAGLVCERVSERGRYATAFSTYGAGPEGTRGLYLLAGSIGARPRRWAEELGRLPEGGGMLVALGDCGQLMRREVGRIERENLKRWIERGGVLVVAGVVDYTTMDTLGVEIVRDEERCAPRGGLIGMMARAEGEGGEEDEQAQRELDELPERMSEDPVGTYDDVTEEEGVEAAHLATATDAPLLGMRPVGMRRPLGVLTAEDARATEILRLEGDEGPAVGMRVEVGRGAIIALGSASLFANRDLRTQGGGVLFARLVREHAPRGPVLFDEYHLGVGQRRSMMRYLRQVGLTGVVVQVMLLVLFVIWRSGARFGGTKTDPAPEPAGTASYVDGVAVLYEKARDPAGAGRIVIRRALARIAAAHHLGTPDAERMVKLLDERRRRVAADAVRTLAARLERGLGSGSLAKLVEEVDALVLRANDDAARAE
jgi:hypothetical protein